MHKIITVATNTTVSKLDSMTDYTGDSTSGRMIRRDLTGIHAEHMQVGLTIPRAIIAEALRYQECLC